MVRPDAFLCDRVPGCALTDHTAPIRSPASYGIAWVHGIRAQGNLLDGGADPGADGMAMRV